MGERDFSDSEYEHSHNSPTTTDKRNNTIVESTTQPIHSSIQQPTIKTPIVTASVMKRKLLLQKHRGNYSAKASSLTARLLEEDFIPSCLDQSVIVHHPP